MMTEKRENQTFERAFDVIQLTAPFHENRKRSIALELAVAHREIQHDRLELAEQQHELKSEKLLGKLELSVVRRQHSDGHVESPNATEDCQSDERNEVEDYVVKRLDVLDVNQIQGDEDGNVSDWHLKDQKAEEVKLVSETRKSFSMSTSLSGDFRLSLGYLRPAKRTAATERRRPECESFLARHRDEVALALDVNHAQPADKSFVSSVLDPTTTLTDKVDTM
jgi:hypothetical protein